VSAIRTFEDLLVGRKAFELCVDVYRATQGFPGHERYGLTSELRKTARSVVYNTAEGNQRWSTLEYVRFLQISLGSAAELETQLLLSRALGYLEEQSHELLVQRLLEIGRMLQGLQRRLRSRLSSPTPPPADP
jgi:four helix bundle protein